MRTSNVREYITGLLIYLIINKDGLNLTLYITQILMFYLLFEEHFLIFIFIPRYQTVHNTSYFTIPYFVMISSMPTESLKSL
jgi:hypothetical protein